MLVNCFLIITSKFNRKENKDVYVTVFACSLNDNLNKVLIQYVAIYAVSPTPHLPPSTNKCTVFWVILLWVLLLAMKNVSTSTFSRFTFWMAWAHTAHSCTLLGRWQGFVFSLSTPTDSPPPLGRQNVHVQTFVGKHSSPTALPCGWPPPASAHSSSACSTAWLHRTPECLWK